MATTGPRPKRTGSLGAAIGAVCNGAALAAWAEALRKRANGVNRDNGSPETLSREDMVELWRRCGGRCTLTGIGFSETVVGTGRAKRAFAPSLDRIDPEDPYSLENCRLVLAVVNFALNRFGIEVFDHIVVGRARTRKWLSREALGRGKPGNPPADCGSAGSFSSARTVAHPVRRQSANLAILIDLGHRQAGPNLRQRDNNTQPFDLLVAPYTQSSPRTRRSSSGSIVET